MVHLTSEPSSDFSSKVPSQSHTPVGYHQRPIMLDLKEQSGLLEPIDVSEYLFTRLYQIGVRSVHGVPGDYNLVVLDYLPRCGLKWVGSVNELNAGL